MFQIHVLLSGMQSGLQIFDMSFSLPSSFTGEPPWLKA